MSSDMSFWERVVVETVVGALAVVGFVVGFVIATEMLQIADVPAAAGAAVFALASAD